MLSVALTTCNRNDLLSVCLETLAPGGQDLPADQYEVIVSDDGPHGEARALVQERFPFARWVEGPRRGVGPNKNHAARSAAGEWIVFLDDDCVPTRKWLARYQAAAQTNPGTRVFEGSTTCRAGFTTPLEHAPINLTGGYLVACNFMIASAAFNAFGGFDEGFPYAYGMEDVDLRERMRAAGEKMVFVADAEIDHPPRRLPAGWKLAEINANYIYFLKKHHRRVSARTVAWETLRTRMRRITKHPPGPDTLRAIQSLGQEMASIAVNWPRWMDAAEKSLKR